MKVISKGVYEVPLVLSESLKHHEDFFKHSIIKAQRNIVEFAYQNDFLHLVEPTFIKHVEIYDTQEGLKEGLISLLNLDANYQLPKTISAVLENKVLMSISPDIYRRIYPIEGEDPNGFERLLTHEIAHRLHIRILDNDEEEMGPLWFFEGFATYVSKQFPNFNCTVKEIWDIIENDQSVSYKYYAAIFKYLTKYISIVDLVNHAFCDNFQDYIKEKVF